MFTRSFSSSSLVHVCCFQFKKSDNKKMSFLYKFYEFLLKVAVILCVFYNVRGARVQEHQQQNNKKYQQQQQRTAFEQLEAIGNEDAQPQQQQQSDLQCTFFNHRAPEPNYANDLRNCSWYKELSCCQQPELETLFRRVRPLANASAECILQLNIMICWVCDPYQAQYYAHQQQLLTLCENFCNDILDACGNALLKGRTLASTYKTGRDFCLSRGFDVRPDNKCFTYDAHKLSLSDDAAVREFAVEVLHKQQLQQHSSFSNNAIKASAQDTAPATAATDAAAATATADLAAGASICNILIIVLGIVLNKLMR